MKVKLYDCAVLVHHLQLANSKAAIGWGDAERTMNDYRKLMNADIHLPKEVVEGGLWACNMTDEIGKFKHFDGLSLDKFIKKLTPEGQKFNKIFNLFEEK